MVNQQQIHKREAERALGILDGKFKKIFKRKKIFFNNC
jgi:hypothetical protein